jgi:hypothetical protein
VPKQYLKEIVGKMAQKTKFRLYALLFCVTVFIINALGLAFFWYKMLVPPFWFGFIYPIAYILLIVFAHDFFIVDSKLSRKKSLLLVLGVLAISSIVTHSVWAIVTPRWSFSVTTDKNTYRLGENVTITATLRNHGLIAHSFKSSISDPVVIHIRAYMLTSIWYTPRHYNLTEFTVFPNQPLERTFVWNQTKSVNIEFGKEIEPGTYYIGAHIPGPSSEPFIGYEIFRAWTSINITST